MLMINQGIDPQIYTPHTIVEKYNTINTIGSVNCGGTNLDPNNSFVYYILKPKTTKEEILELFENEVFFDTEDEISAEREIERLIVKKQGNFYNYYD